MPATDFSAPSSFAPAGVALRLSGAADEAAIFAIWQRSVRATHDFVAPGDMLYFESLIRDRYVPGRAFLIAVDGTDRPLAFMGMSGAHIDSLFVDAPCFGRGIGKALVSWAGIRHERLTVDVNEQNHRGRSFYAGRGFHQIGRSARDHSNRPYPLLHLSTRDPRESRSE